jgi:hypothetical protein
MEKRYGFSASFELAMESANIMDDVSLRRNNFFYFHGHSTISENVRGHTPRIQPPEKRLRNQRPQSLRQQQTTSIIHNRLSENSGAPYDNEPPTAFHHSA